MENSTLSTSLPDISVVILCYRAEDFVPVFVEQVKKVLEVRNLSYQLVLVANYNASQNPPDRTPDIAREVAALDSRIVVVAKKKEGMMGWDLRSGIEAANGQTIAFIDGDGQMPPEDIIKVYNELTKNKCDVAKTYRIERNDGPYRFTLSKIYNLFLKLLFPKISVHDANSKPKIFTQKALSQLHLTSSRWFIDAEIIIQASYLGFSIGEVGTVFHKNEHRPSFINLKEIIGFTADMIKYRIRTLFHKGNL